MQAGQVLDRLLWKICPDMHKLRRTALFVNVMAALHGAVLTVTHLGRAISSDAKEKHCIKRADRLLSNRRLQRERLEVYMALSGQLIGSKQRPVLLVDWSDMDECKRHFLLRASVPVEGRALTVYEEVHTLRTKEKPKTHQRFLQTLQKMLPTDCRPMSLAELVARPVLGVRKCATFGSDFLAVHEQPASKAELRPLVVDRGLRREGGRAEAPERDALRGRVECRCRRVPGRHLLNQVAARVHRKAVLADRPLRDERAG